MIVLRRIALTLTLAAAAYTSLAQTLVQTRPTQASHFISVASLRISPRAWEHFEKARLADEANSQPAFDREFASALQTEPAFASLYLLRAARLLHARQYEPSIADILAAQAIEPDAAPAHILLAANYNSLHRFHDALLALQFAKSYEAGSWQATYEAARAWIGLKNPQEALRTSALTLRLAPETCIAAHILRGDALSLATRYPEAIAEFHILLAAEPDTPRAATLRAIVQNLRTKQQAMQDQTQPTSEIASR